MKYVFDPDRLHTIAAKGIGLSHKDMVSAVSQELAEAYPGHIDPDPEWVYSMAAGIKGSMAVLHASLSEYLVIFGTSLQTSGFSGRYKVEIHDFLMSGEMWTEVDDNLGERIVSGPGDHLVLRPDQTKLVSIPDGSWMLEYGRGPVISALPLSMADALLSCGDLHTVRQTFRVYGKLTMSAIRQRRNR